MSKNKWFLNGGRGSGRTFRLLCASYENKIAELQSECRTCVYTDSPCVRSDYPSKDGVCSHYKNIFEENAELKKNYEDSLVVCGVLKNKIELLAQPSPIESMQDILITVQKAAYEKQKEQLTTAKELLKWALHSDPEHDEDFEKKWEEAEQFLKETK